MPESVSALSSVFHYNDLESLERLFQEYPGQIAGVILEPVTTEVPKPGFLEGVRAISQREGAVLIFDEMISGFRWHTRGAQAYFGVMPDLATFGKGIANGFSVAALTGRRDIMELGGLLHRRPRVFLLSSTHGGETHALAACRETIREIVECDVVAHLWSVGKRLQDGLNDAASRHGLGARVRCGGYPCSPILTFSDLSGRPAPGIRTLFLQEMVKRSILIPYIAPSYSHGVAEVDQTVAAASQAFELVARVVGGESLDRYLVGPATKPVFRRYNFEE